MTTTSNPIEACTDIFIQPRKALTAIQQNDNWSWVAFIIVMAMTLAPLYLFTQFVDMQWYIDSVVSLITADVSPAEKEAIQSFYTPSTVLYTSLISAFLFMLVYCSILALYLNVVTKSDEENLDGFMDWFGMTWWTLMPSIFAGLVSILVMYMSSTNQLNNIDIAPFSLAYWLGLDLSSDWMNFASAIRLDTIWTIYLIAVGIETWTNFSKGKSLKLAIIPFVALYGVWALIKLV